MPSYRTRSVFIALLVLVISLIPAVTAFQQETGGLQEAGGLIESACIGTLEIYPRNEAAEKEIITRLNRWRMRSGLGPVLRHSLLDVIALNQACLVIPDAPFYPGYDFHTDNFGDGIAGRARAFGWPSYEYPNQMLVSEIAAYHANIDGHFNFWHHSPPHRAAAISPSFRELGVAVLEYRGWLLAFVVLAGRPDVLPVGYDPIRSTLVMTVDTSIYSEQSAFVPTRMRILNSDRQPLHSQPWLLWNRQVPLPAGSSPTVIVVVSDGITEIETTVTLADSLLFPSVPVPLPGPTPMPSPTPTPVLQTPTPMPPTPTLVPTVPASSGGFDLRVVWDNNAISIINVSGRHLDLTGLAISAPDIGLLRDGRWLGHYYQGDMSSFPQNYCLQVWSYIIFPGPPDLPQGCTMLASGRSNLSAGQRFWLTDAFYFNYDGQRVAACLSDWGVCEFDIPR